MLVLVPPDAPYSLAPSGWKMRLWERDEIASGNWSWYNNCLGATLPSILYYKYRYYFVIKNILVYSYSSGSSCIPNSIIVCFPTFLLSVHLAVSTPQDTTPPTTE